jgi:hypothetical protein
MPLLKLRWGSRFLAKDNRLGNLIVADVYYDPVILTAKPLGIVTKWSNNVRAKTWNLFQEKLRILTNLITIMLLLFYVVTELAQYKL